MAIKSDHYAVVIGIDHYVNLPEPASAAGNAQGEARSDAQAFNNWLLSEQGGCLSPENVRLFANDVPCNNWHVERALRNLGIQSGVRVGGRLYFYFSGYSVASASAPNDVIMLMGGASPADFSDSISLNSYRQYFQMAAPFDEVVFILDNQRVDSGTTTIFIAQPPFTSPSVSRLSDPIRELVVANANDAFTANGRGILTQALLETLNQASTEPDGQRSSSSLVADLKARVQARASELHVDQPLFTSQTGEIYFRVASDVTPTGTLIVEVPHWTTIVHVYDGLYRPVANVIEVRDAAPNTGAWESEINLPQGVYQVECMLSGTTETQYVMVNAGKVTRIKRAAWKHLVATATAPLADVPVWHETQIVRAEQHSLQPTWADAPGGDSRLFVFVRTRHPQRNPAFADGLQLLTATGELVTDFSEGVSHNDAGGWMAFNADLPSGYYILRRGRRGVSVCHQAVYLCAGWETHVFFVAHHNYPSMSTMTQDMARLGAGFHAKSETTSAAEAVLGILRTNGPTRILDKDMLRPLISDKLDNPWLGILAAYALLRGGSDLNTLLPSILDFLARTIGDHPDVRALLLNDDQPASEEFWYPPILRDGIHRVQQHSTRFLHTFPLNSLTDLVLDNLMGDTAWTAWHELDREPVQPPETTSETASETSRVKSRFNAVTKSRRPDAKTPVYTSALIQSASPKQPVYRFGVTVPREVEPTTPPVKKAVFSAPATVDTIFESALLKQAHALTSNLNVQDLPPTMAINLYQDTEALLNGISPLDVSGASGISLERTERSLESLRYKTLSASTQTIQPGIADASAENQLSRDEQIVFEYAVKRASPSTSPSFLTVPPESDAPTSTPDAEAKTIEEMTVNLRAEADRLRLKRDADADNTFKARALAERLIHAADALVHAADFIVLTDKDSNILYANGAFLLLNAPEGEPVESPDSAPEQADDPLSAVLEANRQVWVDAIRALKPEDVTLTNPLDGGIGATLTVRRTILNDEHTGQQWHLYVFRFADAPRLSSEKLREISASLSDVSYFASLYAYGSAPLAGFYLSNLESTIVQVETAMLPS